jgi:glycosyltransferase involved in cell wall biosynthesis
MKRLFPKALRIADQHNVDHLLHQQNNDLNCPKHKQTFNYLKIQESNLYKNADCFFACSEADKVALETVNDHRLEGFVVPNGTTNKPVKRHILDVLEPKLIFCGSLDYNPNKNGLLWFYETIWPSLKTSIKGLTLTVIGRNGFDKAYAPLKIDKQIDFVGEVKDVTPYYLKNNIAIVPLLEGSGTRLKILEAMSFGLPVISTSIGAEGIDYIENKHIIIANDAALFQQAIIDNIKKPAILKKIGKQSSMLITEKYTWQKIVRKMAENLISNENKKHLV